MQAGSVHVHLNLVHDINVGLAGQFAGTNLVQREIIVLLRLFVVLSHHPVNLTMLKETLDAGVIAIRPIDVEQKSAVSVGYAVVLLDNCIANTEGVSCGTCARHCPALAIHMVEGDGGVGIPTVDENQCLGCGACEYYCPARPFSAIYVEGRDTHIQV